MTRAAGIGLASVLSALSLTGCLRYTVPVGPYQELTPAERNFQAVWNASLEVLRRYNFTVDRQDRRAGEISTLPMTGRHWFEFWRHDAATPADVAEGTAQTVYRAAKVVIRPTAPGAATFKFTVEVRTARSDQPQPQVTGASDTIFLYNVTQQYERFVDERKAAKRRAWLLMGDEDIRPGYPMPLEKFLVPLGRDGALEARLTGEIASRCAGAVP